MYKLFPAYNDRVAFLICVYLSCWERRWLCLLRRCIPPTLCLMSRFWCFFATGHLPAWCLWCKPWALDSKLIIFPVFLTDKLCVPFQHCKNSHDQTQGVYHIRNNTVQVSWSHGRLHIRWDRNENIFLSVGSLQREHGMLWGCNVADLEHRLISTSVISANVQILHSNWLALQ